MNLLLTRMKVLSKIAYYLSKVLGTSTKLIWYYAFVYSLLVTFIIILLSASINLIYKIQSSQFKIIKILFNIELYYEIYF
jgi:hypothetical protein